jgi:hypothetical protein
LFPAPLIDCLSPSSIETDLEDRHSLLTTSHRSLSTVITVRVVNCAGVQPTVNPGSGGSIRLGWTSRNVLLPVLRTSAKMARDKRPGASFSIIEIIQTPDLKIVFSPNLRADDNLRPVKESFNSG